jgi:hypothetical protein
MLRGERQPERPLGKERKVADFGLFVGFGFPARGREQQATKVFGEAVELWTRWQQEGQIEDWGAYFLEPHGGDLGGFFLLRGEQDAIARLRGSDEMLKLSTRASLIVENFGVVGVETGARIDEQMGIFMQASADLA